ncbi:hypothetical protein [Longispora urticae]
MKAITTVRRIAAALGSAAVVSAALIAAPTAAQATPTCTATYADIDLPNRAAYWSVTCTTAARVFVDAQLWYDNTTLVNLPDAGARQLAANETWTVYTQDATHTGAAWHGVLHIVQEYPSGPPAVLAHVSK